MPNYKIVNTDQLDADLKTVADSIREKSGQSGSLAFPSGFVSAVDGIQTGGGGGGLETCTVRVRFDIYLGEGSPFILFYSTIKDGKPERAHFIFGEFDEVLGCYVYPSKTEYDFEVLCGSYIIVDDNWCGAYVEATIPTSSANDAKLAFVPSGTANASISITL